MKALCRVSKKEFMTVEITLEEFHMLPLKTQRRIRRKQAKDAKHAEWMDAMDCEEDP